MKLPNAKVGFSKAMSSGWILLDKSGGAPIVKRKVDKIDDVAQKHLAAIEKGDFSNITDSLKAEFKKRKLVQEVTTKSFQLRKGPEFSTSLQKMETDLTSDMLLSGSWKNLKFKDYNLDARGITNNLYYLIA